MGKELTLKSPLKDPPLRAPGQSLGEEIQRILDDEWMPYFLTTLLFCVFAALEWLRYYRTYPPSPRLVTATAVLLLVYTAFRMYRMRPTIRALRLGMEGEQVVGQSLEELRTRGALVFHDIRAKDFNVDHVVVSPKGIFVIETKTRSKPKGPGATVRYDGKKLFVNGNAPTRDPIQQVQAISAWVQELIKKSTGKYFPVRPVVLFPGWYVETENANAHDKVWVLNPKCLGSFIKNEKVDLPPEDVTLISFHLSRYIRSEKSVQ
jgi:Nuclease-related domain